MNQEAHEIDRTNPKSIETIFEDKLKNVLAGNAIDKIIEENLKDAVTKAIKSSFDYGALRDAIDKKIKETLVPAIEKYNMDEYIPKLNAVLSEIIKQTKFADVARIINNTRNITCDALPDEITDKTLFDLYEKFIKENHDGDGLDVNCDDGTAYAAYEQVEVKMLIHSDIGHSSMSYEYGYIIFSQNNPKLADTYDKRLDIYRNKSESTWRLIRPVASIDVLDLAHMDSFDVMTSKIYSSYKNIRLPELTGCPAELEESDWITIDKEPEATFI